MEPIFTGVDDVDRLIIENITGHNLPMTLYCCCRSIHRLMNSELWRRLVIARLPCWSDNFTGGREWDFGGTNETDYRMIYRWLLLNKHFYWENVGSIAIGAALGGYFEIVKYLSLKSYPVSFGDHKLLGAGCQGGHFPIIDYLLESGADPNMGLAGAAEGGQREVIQYLLDKGADIQYHDTYYDVQGPKCGALTQALISKRWKTANFILDRYPTNPDLSAVVRHLVSLSRVEAMEFLARAAKRRGLTLDLKESLHHCEIKPSSKSDMVKFLLEHGAEPNGSLGMAISYDNIPIAELLLGRGADINNGWYSATDFRPRNGDREDKMLEFCLSHGANVNHDRGIPLVEAANNKRESAARWLLEKGANLNLAIERIGNPPPNSEDEQLPPWMELSEEEEKERDREAIEFLQRLIVWNLSNGPKY